MAPLRPFALLRTRDQWTRSAHLHTAIDSQTGGVMLDWEPVPPAASPPPQPIGGLAFDGECRLYHSVPDEGRVERLLWALLDPVIPRPDDAPPVDLFDPGPASPLGDFAASDPAPAPLRTPRGLAVDEDDRLFVAERGAGMVLVFDLWSEQLLRRVAVGTVAAPRRTPVDLASFGRTVWVLLADPPGLLLMEARGGPVELPLPSVPDDVPADVTPVRIATSAAGELFVLFRDETVEGWVVSRNQAGALRVGEASDLEFDGEGALAVAGGPGDAIRTFRQDPEGWVEGLPLQGWGYDGAGIIRTPEGRIGFWTTLGFRSAFAARVRYRPAGTVTTYRLDAGEFQTQWGRVFVDACIPTGTSMRLRTATSDDPGDDEPGIAWTKPTNMTGEPYRSGLTPPMRPVRLEPRPGEPWVPLHSRETGREVPWARPAADDPFETYEAPVLAEPGRYLWVTLELLGNTRFTPRVKAIRVERPAHDLVRRLPRAYSREAAMGSFLQRYLAMFDGAMVDLEDRSAERGVLLHPQATPEELLPWLAGFLGLVLDLRWPPAARRQLVKEVTWLFRFRGTVPGLRRFIEIYLGEPVVFIEQWRLRGLGSGLLGGDEASPSSNSILGGGFRIGGAVGEPGESPLEGSADDAFATNAHRFTVLVPGSLTSEQEDVVLHVLDVHRPAHTIVDLCTAGAGMRAGRGLHVGLSSVIGRTGGFSTIRLGDAVLGRESLVGRPEPGIRPGMSHLGVESRAG